MNEKVIKLRIDKYSNCCSFCFKNLENSNNIYAMNDDFIDECPFIFCSKKCLLNYVKENMVKITVVDIPKGG